MSLSLIIVILTTVTSLIAFQNEEIQRKLLFSPFHVHHNSEYYRFLSGGFIHANYIHLIINMIVLWSFGGVVEQYYSQVFPDLGRVYFIVLYVLGIVLSDIPTYFKNKDNVRFASLGASGAVSAVVFASILFNPWAKIYIWGLIGIPGILLGVAYLVYSVIKSKQGTDLVNHDAHFWGAMFGVVFTIILKPDVAFHFIDQLTKGLPL
jgi:membrane associated rhomboid family serine protease